MVTAGHVIFALGKLAANHSGIRSDIVANLTAVETWPYKPECLEILIGKVLTAVESLVTSMSKQSDDFMAVKQFTERHLNSGRTSISRSARRIIRMSQCDK